MALPNPRASSTAPARPATSRRSRGAAREGAPAPQGGERVPARPPFRLTAPRAALAYLGLALLFLAPGLAPGSHLTGIDYSAAGFPVLEWVDRVFASGGLPTWIPGIMGGVPIFANPGASFHPVRLLLSAVLPAGYILAAFFAVHFTLAGVGMYLLLRELRTRRWVAFLGGLVYEFAGPLASLLYAGHDGRFIVAASAPLVLWAVHRGARTGAVAPFALLATLLGLCMLGFQLQSVYYLLLLSAAWAVYALVAHGAHRQPAALARRVGLGLGAVALAFAVAAVNLLPFADYVDDSPRAATTGRGYAFATSYSMPLAETVGLAVPEQTGVIDTYRGTNPIKYHTEYVGALVLALVLLGVGVAWRDRRWRFFAATAVVALTVAWGGSTPIYRLYYAILPGTTKFRAPGIAIYVVALALVVVAALALERIAALRDDDRASRTARVGGRVLAALCLLGFALGVEQLLTLPGSEAGGGWVRFSAFLALTAGALVLWLRRTIGTPAVAIALGVLAVADLWLVDRRFMLVLEEPDRLYAADDVVEFLRAQPDLGRVWVFPRAPEGGRGYLGNGHFGVYTNYLMRFGIPQVGGEHGNQLQRWNEYIGAGKGRQFVDWHNLIASVAMRDAAAIRYAVSNIDLTRSIDRQGRVTASGFVPVYRGSATVYRNENALPRAYVVPAVEVASGAAGLAAMEREGWDPRRTAIVETPLATPLPGGEVRATAAIVADAVDSVVVRVTADRPAFLVLADNHYAGWTATVDGRPATLHRANYTFRGVEVGAGDHEVKLRFHPVAFHRGLRISLASAFLLLAYGAVAAARWAWARRRPTADGPAPATA